MTRLGIAATLLLITVLATLVALLAGLIGRALERYHARLRRQLAQSKAQIDTNIARMRAEQDLMAIADAVREDDHGPAVLTLSTHDRWWLRRVGLDLDTTGADR